MALEFDARGLRVFATAQFLKSVANLLEKGLKTCTLNIASAVRITALREEISKRTDVKLNILFNNAGARSFSLNPSHKLLCPMSKIVRAGFLSLKII